MSRTFRQAPSPTSTAAVLLASLGLVACAVPGARANPQPQEVAHQASPNSSSLSSASAAAPEHKEPPPPPVAEPPPLPPINQKTLPNGFEVWHVASPALPLVHLRLVVRAGTARDGDRAGVSRLTALVLNRSASYRSDGQHGSATFEPAVDVRTTQEATVFSTVTVKNHVDEALDRLGVTVRQPRLDNAPLTELRTQERSRRFDLARSDTRWIGETVLLRELYRSASPSLSGPAVPAAEDGLSKLTSADCKSFHKNFYVPKNVSLVVVGDMTFDEATQEAQRVFGSWEGAAPAPYRPAAPAPIDYTRFVVADRPGAAESVVCVASLGPPKDDAAWPSLWIGESLIAAMAKTRGSRGVAGAGRLDAPTLGLGVSQGPTPFAACLTCPVTRTAWCADGLLDAVRAVSSRDPGASEIEVTRRSVLETLALGTGSVPRFADFAADIQALGMPSHYPEMVTRSLRAASPSQIASAVRAYVRDGHLLVVVIGDASTTADTLSRFGDGVVLDPVNGFAKKRTIAANPSVALPERTVP